MRTIEIFYKCACMKDEAVVTMRERLEGEDVQEFMHHVMLALSVDHNNRSPKCKQANMEYAKVPADAATGIGMTGAGNA